MNKSEIREEIFKLVYSLAVQNCKDEQQIDIYLVANDFPDKVKEQIKDVVLKIIDLKPSLNEQISKNLKS